MSNLIPSSIFDLDRAWRHVGAPEESPSYAAMIASLRDFLDKAAAAKPDEATIASIARDLQAWSDRLAPSAVEPGKQLFGRQYQTPGRGSAMLPLFVPEAGNARSVEGSVTFGRFFCGAGSRAVHGGAITLLFDDVLGRLANSGGPPKARTAYLRTDFRAITPVDTPLRIRAWLAIEEGRKRRLRGEIRHEGVLCAEAEGLFIVLNPGQP